MTKRPPARDIGRLMRDGAELDAAFYRAIYKALDTHRKLGQAVAMSVNGKPVMIPASRIRLPKP